MPSVDEAGDRDRTFQGAARRRQTETTEEGAGVGAHTEERGPRVPRRSKRDAKEALSEAVARDMRALKREPRRAASRKALSKQARSAATRHRRRTTA